MCIVFPLQGVRTATIPFSEGEGAATVCDVNGKYLALATSGGFIKIFDVSRSPPKQVRLRVGDMHVPSLCVAAVGYVFVQLCSGKFEDSKSGTSFGEIRSIRCNADGTRVSILANKKVNEKSRWVAPCA